MPSVVWRRNGVEVKNGGRYTLYSKKRLEGVHTVLDIGRLTRDELKASFMCEATNRIVDKALSSTVTIDLIREFSFVAFEVRFGLQQSRYLHAARRTQTARLEMRARLTNG